MTDETLIGALRLQAEVCRGFGSPFNGAMLTHMADDLVAGGPVRDLLAPWRDATTRKLVDDAIALRLVNAFTHLALGDEAPELARLYPRDGAPGDPDAAWTMARAQIGPFRGHLEDFMSHEPQTNEVRRSGVLLGGFLTIAAETGLPLSLFEIGASAGLNVLWDRFHYRLGDAAWGDAAATVRIPVDWSGPLPPLRVQPQIVARAACDRRPTDLADPAQRRRLLACIWPDQLDRLERSRAAIDLALAEGVQVAAADALAWTRANVGLRPGVASVLYHSVFWQYLPAETQAGLNAAIQALGASASPDSPFAWLRMEPSEANPGRFELNLTLWPDGATRTLAEVHAHGAWVKWSDPGV